MADQWIIRVQGKEYGPADLATLREWKADGRVLPANPARQADVNEAHWKGPATFLACFKSNHRRCKDQPEISDQPPTRKAPASQRESAIRNRRADRQVGIFWSKPFEFIFEVSFNSSASHC